MSGTAWAAPLPEADNTVSSPSPSLAQTQQASANAESLIETQNSVLQFSNPPQETFREEQAPNGDVYTFDSAGRLVKSRDIAGNYTLYSNHHPNNTPGAGSYYNAQDTHLSDFTYYDDWRFNTATRPVPGGVETDTWLYDASKNITGYQRRTAQGDVWIFNASWQMTKATNAAGYYTIFSSHHANNTPSAGAYYDPQGHHLEDFTYYDDWRFNTATRPAAGGGTETDTWLYNASKQITGYERRTSQGDLWLFNPSWLITKATDPAGNYTIYSGEYYPNTSPMAGDYYTSSGSLVGTFTFYDDKRFRTFSHAVAGGVEVETWLYDANKQFTGLERRSPDGSVYLVNTSWQVVKLLKKIYTDGSYDLFTAYNADGSGKTADRYDAQGARVGTSDFYAGSRVKTVQLFQPDAKGNVYYEYKNENWAGTGSGRVDRARRAQQQNGEFSSLYVYDATGALKRIKLFSDANWQTILPQTHEDMIEVASSFFSQGSQVVDPVSGYVYEMPGKTYTQPTNIGFFAQYLSMVAAGDITVAEFSKEQAIVTLQKLAQSLLTDQATLGYKGLLPWFEIQSAARTRANGEPGSRVMFGDNANLSTSLASVIGALTGVTGDTRVTDIRQKLELFLDRQGEGYQYLFDAGDGRFRAGWSMGNNAWMGGNSAPWHMDRLGNEFAGGVLFVTLRYGFADSPYQKLVATLKNYTLSDGRTLTTIAPYDGGAFQLLWQVLTMPELDSPGYRELLENFVDIAFDYSTRNGLLGLLSASFAAKKNSAGADVIEYDGKQGIPQIAETTDSLYTQFASLYALGGAYTVSPEKTEAFIRRIFAARPDLVTSAGFSEGVNLDGHVSDKQLAANELSLLIGMAGTGPAHMAQYLTARGLKSRFDAFLAPSAVTPVDSTRSANVIYFASGRQGLGQEDYPARNFMIRGTSYVSSDAVYFVQPQTFSASGGRLRLRFVSNTDALTGSVSLDANDPYPSSRVSIPVDFSNTHGAEKEILIDLPTLSSLSSLKDVSLHYVLQQANLPIDLKITLLEILP